LVSTSDACSAISLRASSGVNDRPKNWLIIARFIGIVYTWPWWHEKTRCW
jgi:hypothetical protein